MKKFPIYLDCIGNFFYICNNKNKQIPNIMSNTDKIWRAIERVSNKFINALHGEANGYTFRYLDGTWKTADYDFINGLAGLGNEKRDLTD